MILDREIPARRPFRRNHKEENHGDIIGHTLFEKKLPRARETKEFRIKVDYKDPEEKEKRPFNIRVGYKNSDESDHQDPKPGKFSPKNLKKSCSPSNDVILDPQEQKFPARRHTDADKTSVMRHEREEIKQKRALRKHPKSKPQDNRDHFVYDPETSEKYISKVGGRRTHAPCNSFDEIFGPAIQTDHIIAAVPLMSSKFSPPTKVHQRNDMISPRGRNITRSSSNGNILEWDPKVDANQPPRADIRKHSNQQ